MSRLSGLGGLGGMACHPGPGTIFSLVMSGCVYDVAGRATPAESVRASGGPTDGGGVLCWADCWAASTPANAGEVSGGTEAVIVPAAGGGDTKITGRGMVAAGTKVGGGAACAAGLAAGPTVTTPASGRATIIGAAVASLSGPKVLLAVPLPLNHAVYSFAATPPPVTVTFTGVALSPAPPVFLRVLGSNPSRPLAGVRVNAGNTRLIDQDDKNRGSVSHQSLAGTLTLSYLAAGRWRVTHNGEVILDVTNAALDISYALGIRLDCTSSLPPNAVALVTVTTP